MKPEPEVPVSKRLLLLFLLKYQMKLKYIAFQINNNRSTSSFYDVMMQNVITFNIEHMSTEFDLDFLKQNIAYIKLIDGDSIRKFMYIFVLNKTS